VNEYFGKSLDWLFELFEQSRNSIILPIHTNLQLSVLHYIASLSKHSFYKLSYFAHLLFCCFSVLISSSLFKKEKKPQTYIDDNV